MNRLTAAWPVALGFASLALVAGCNGAEFTQPPPPDAGPPCSTIAPIIRCDAGGPASVNACTAEPAASDTVVSRIPSGNYPVGCSVQFYFSDFGGGCAPAPNPCTCLAGSGSGDASAPAQWSSCADAGISGP